MPSTDEPLTKNVGVDVPISQFPLSVISTVKICVKLESDSSLVEPAGHEYGEVASVVDR